MSVNKRTLILHRTIDSEGTRRELNVFEEANNENKTISASAELYANTYSHVTFEYEYSSNAFNYADVSVTNRFTMDSITKTQINCASTQAVITPLVLNNDQYTSYVKTYYDNSRKRTIAEVVLSMCDFMYGDIYVQFYNESANTDQYCAPIIVQFTNAPTVYTTDVYKWRPTTATVVADEDSIFTSSFGSVSANIPDTGRTNVLTNDDLNTEYYNDFMDSDRLITNGIPENYYSVSSHPVYVIEYRSFVPSAISYEFGDTTITDAQQKRNSIGFAFANTSAYLTSAVNTSANDLYEMLKTDGYIALSGRVAEEQLDYALPVTNTYSAIGHYMKFNVYLTANNTDDKWLREHTRACADFILTGVDSYWMSDDKS